ncbi:MAG: anthranilate synthase component I family protein, partial [Saprospiraceae bacterium]
MTLRKTLQVTLPGEAATVKKQLLHWANAQTVAVCLDHNDHPAGPDHSWDFLAAAGVADELRLPVGQAFPALADWMRQRADWCFGTFAYDLKNELERLDSKHPDGIGWPDLYFFQPEVVVGLRGDQMTVFSKNVDPQTVIEKIFNSAVPDLSTLPAAAVPLQTRFQRSEYLATVAAIREHILAGDVYELNFCQEFFAEGLSLDPLAIFNQLNAFASAPFSAYFRLHDRYLCCASPERFLKKRGDQLISQPIKGTRGRGATPEEDAAIRQELAASEKDRAENVMIVDLVRNDLARSCQPGSVRVVELFGIYTFETVHQMISTITGTLRADQDGLSALRAAFPMGSMTGAPKVMAMQLIERYERSRRGLYAGAVGYCTPNGDFD